MNKEYFENEEILEDDYPVYGEYIYLCDGDPIRSGVFGTVKDLKLYLKKNWNFKACQIRSCNLRERGLL